MDIIIPILIVGGIGLVAGIGLALASKFMAVPVDEKQEQLRAALPGANCGACGFSGCDGYAEALCLGKAEPNKCAPGGAEAAARLAEILGVEVEAEEPKKAFIACRGTAEGTVQSYEYNGMQSCTAANLLHGGPLACAYGCLGFGDCSRACDFGAITLENGRPTVCREKCVACGKCAAACPKGLISLIPQSASVYVGCSNRSKGPAVVKSCKSSCIACMQCEKNCPTGAVKVINNIAVIDYSLCSGCGKCREVCKRGVIF